MKPLVVRDLVKIYPGGTRALKGINFEVNEGEIFGLIGPNGAGKTTTLRIISTILRPTSGSCRVFGLDVIRNSLEVRKLISYLPEESGAYRNLKGIEFLRFIAKFRAKNFSEMESMIREGARICGLGENLHKRIKTYSKGMLRRLVVASTLMTNPKLAILDEPTAGLDVLNARTIRDIIKNFANERGTAVILSSHNMLEVEYLCDRVAIIHKGEILAKGAPKELLEEYEASNLEDVFMRVISR